MTYIDAHMHYAGERPEVIKWLAQEDCKLLNIGGADHHGEAYRRLAKQHPDRYAWCTSFQLEGFEGPDYADKVIEGLKKDFADGAIACKVFKRLGMKLQDAQGKYAQIDDPIFDPIFSWLEAEGHTLLVHVADPIGRWKPLDEKDPYFEYFEKTPEGQMCNREGVPHHSDILAARDRVIERHPKLRVVGAHLGSLEHDLDALAKLLDKYPNFAVDTSGVRRIVSLFLTGRDKVWEFFIKYQDRIMYGSDRSVRDQLEMSEEKFQESFGELKEAFQSGWDYYTTDKTFTLKGYEVRGLGLPQDVLKKLFYTNAKKWYPGI